MSSWFDLPASTWGCEESWPETPSTVVDITSPCSSVTTLVLDLEPTNSQPPPRRPPPVFEFIPGTIVSKPHKPLRFKHAENIYKFLFRFQNKLSIAADRQHTLLHWFYCRLDYCPYHDNPRCH